MAEYIFKIDEALYDDVTGQMVMKPEMVGELIRCTDCRHYYFADNRIPLEQQYTCALDGDRWKPDSFCSFAERREDETD